MSVRLAVQNNNFKNTATKLLCHYIDKLYKIVHTPIIFLLFSHVLMSDVIMMHEQTYEQYW